MDFDSNNDLARIKQGFNDTNTKDLSTAQRNKVSFGKFLLFNESGSKRPNITLNTVTFTKKKYVFNVAQNRIYFEDFEKLSDASFLDGKNAPTEAPNASQQGKYYLYGGRGKILSDPTFGKYYQNLADADEYTKSLSENFLRYTFTDSQRDYNEQEIKKTGAASVGFWVNGQVAVDYELPLERGSMFCIFSNDRFRKADNFDERARFMFDLSCNGWTYLYMPNTHSSGVDIGWNEFIYGEKAKNSGVANPLQSLFGKDNYTNPLDQSKHKFYDDKKWHYVTYVMDNQLMRITVYLDGEKTGEIADWSKLPEADHRDKPNGNPSGTADLVGRTKYLRNIILGGFTPHGLFYDRQYYSDAALAYDDIAIYSKALTQEEIRSIIEQKQYTPKEWHYGDSFKEYNESKGGHEDPHDVSGLGVNGSFDSRTGYLNVNSTLTIPNVPKGYYVRIEYDGNDDATSSADDKFTYVGLREEEKPEGFYVATYKATKEGVNTYTVNVTGVIKVRSIVITPYQYATLKYGNMEEDEFGQFFLPLDKDNKYVAFNVKREGTTNYYSSEDNKEELGENPALPILTLNIDGERKEDGEPIYKTISKYVEGKNNPYIKYTSTSPHVAYINKSGQIKMTGIAGNTFIIAELISDNLYNGSEVLDSFEIRIRKEERTLRLENGDKVNVNQKFEELDNITLTIGGWKHEGTNTYNIPGVGTVSDSWADATDFEDPILGMAGVLDGFNQYSAGTHVARSESLGEYYPKQDFANNITPWNLPCRGAYIKVEPLKAGIVSIYLRQEGNLYDKVYDKGHSRHVTWRPVYITDETGTPVDFVQPATNGLITYNDNFFVGDKRRAQFIEGIEETYNDDASLRQDLLNLKKNDYEKFRILIDNWNNAGWRQKVIPTGDGGYMVMSDAVVRYTFNVHPGKTYYLFSNQTQVAISGFNFEQGRLLNTRQGYNYETSPVRNVTRGTKLTWQDNLENQPSIPTSANNDITTVVYERNFAQGKWSSICLPFSMNNRQMREQFGEETAVVLLKTIHEDGKMELIWHVNQDIIAGYPYFILPKGKLKNTNVKNGVITKITADAYFNDRINAEHPLFSVGSNGQTFDWQDVYDGANYNRDYPYVFEGNFSNEELPAGSYVMSNNGALTKIKNAVTAKPFRAYMKYQGSDANHAKPLYTSINWQNDETTSIDDIIFQNGILMEASDVYGIDGTVIRRNVQNLSNLSKGVYIVNGKKFVVK